MTAVACSSGDQQQPDSGFAATAGHASPAAAASGGDAGSSSVGVSALGGLRTLDELYSGLCQLQSITPDPQSCRGIPEVLSCAKKECGVPEMCAELCRDHRKCVDEATDQCAAILKCPSSLDCQLCQERVLACVWIDKCTGHYVCGSTSGSGACAKLKACCATQTDPTACNGFAEAGRMLGGDTFCQTLIDDPGFLKAYASSPTCTF